MNGKKKALALAVVLAAVLLLASALYGHAGGGAAGQAGGGMSSTAEGEVAQAPDFTVFDAEGNAVELSDYLGRPVVVNFWASWCGPCQMEMPEFDAAYRELGGEVVFLMVNMTDGSRETVQSASDFIAGEGYSFPVLYDTERDAAETYGAYSLPTTYFIDADGNLAARAIGAIDADALQQGIDLITTG